jgi:hypothetical protein
LKAGSAFGKVIFGPCKARQDDPNHYSTTLSNTGAEAFRVDRFCGFVRAGEKYVLSTVTGDYFTAREFVAWYGAPKDGWVAPGQSATDPNNYGGGDTYWVYYCTTKSGKSFAIGAKVPRGK